MNASHRRTFNVLNAATAPWWVAMILFPRHRLTARLVDRAGIAFAGLGVAYAGLLARDKADERIDFTEPDSIMAALARPDAFLAGWTHFLVFDLFVGRWIWRTAVAEGRGCRLALLLTWLAGPAGLTLFLIQRRLRPRTQPSTGRVATTNGNGERDQMTAQQ